jgi:hypothetical protein
MNLIFLVNYRCAKKGKAINDSALSSTLHQIISHTRSLSENIKRREDYMKNLYSRKLGLAIIVAFLTIFWISPIQAGEKKKIKYTKRILQNISRDVVYPNDVPKHQISQYVRITSITYSDPDMEPSENIEYGQSDSVAGNGSHRGYSVNTHKNGDKAYNKWEGSHKTIVKEDGEWEMNYDGKFQFTGGTGKFKNVKGGGVYKGTITAKEHTEEGEFEAEY